MDIQPPNFLRPAEMARGPDLLRPGSATAHLGNGETAFIFTKHGDEAGQRFFAFPATVGHETMVTQPNIMKALFGPDLARLKAETKYVRTVYDESVDEGGMPKAIGEVEDFDHWEVRRRAAEYNLLARYGTVRGRRVLMLWTSPAGWEDMLDEVIDRLQVPDDAIITVGKRELGLVREFRLARKEES